jgi:hypothetical protein
MEFDGTYQEHKGHMGQHDNCTCEIDMYTEYND